MQRNLGFSGTLTAKLIKDKSPGIGWHIRNRLRWSYIMGWIFVQLAKLFSRVTGIPTIHSCLKIRAHINGEWIDYGVVAYRVVTNAGVGFLVDDWDDDTTDITTMNYHGCGTGAVAEAASDSALGTEATTALNPDSTRATGTKSQPSANVIQSQATVTFDDTAAITEHGLFSTSGTGTGVLWDRSVFAAINVVSGNTIQFTYQCTVSAGS